MHGPLVLPLCLPASPVMRFLIEGLSRTHWAYLPFPSYSRPRGWPESWVLGCGRGRVILGRDSPVGHASQDLLGQVCVCVFV
jgi:hypothetical protein